LPASAEGGKEGQENRWAALASPRKGRHPSAWKNRERERGAKTHIKNPHKKKKGEKKKKEKKKPKKTHTKKKNMQKNRKKKKQNTKTYERMGKSREKKFAEGTKKPVHDLGSQRVPSCEASGWIFVMDEGTSLARERTGGDRRSRSSEVGKRKKDREKRKLLKDQRGKVLGFFPKRKPDWTGFKCGDEGKGEKRRRRCPLGPR